QSGYTGARTQMMGAQLGGDHRLSANGIVGAALSWSDGKARFERLGGRSEGQQIGASLYGRYGPRRGGYLSGRIGQDWITTDVSRDIVIGQPARIDSRRRDTL